MLPNSVECHLVDFAAMHLGAVPFTIYNSSPPAGIRHQLDNAAAKIVFCEPSLLDNVVAARALGLPELEKLVVVGDPADGGDLTLAELEDSPQPDFDFDAAWRAVGPDDRVTLIYTSGTTGPPKGAEWAHRTVMAQLRALGAAVPLPTENVISFLPMAHAGGRLTSHYYTLAHGATITACPDLRQLPVYLAAVHPDTLFAVPRLWEKFQVAIEAMVAAIEDDQERARAERAIELGTELARAESDGSSIDPELVAEQRQIQPALVPILARLGLDRIKAAFVGGAPSAPELSAFFRAVGVPLLEAYGLTEGSLNIFNRIEEFRGGTAGKPLPGVEVRLGEDGELMIRGELVFVGYRNDPEKTAEALDSEGWLHTGDLAEQSADGFIKIVDRKKEIIINAAGKNMSLANIEQTIKAESSLIGQVVAIGDGRRYNTALITLDPEAVPLYAARLGVEISKGADLASIPELRAEVAAAVERGNQSLSRVEQLKKFKLLPVAWMPDSDELTPTLKLKRRGIAAKYGAEIEALYAE